MVAPTGLTLPLRTLGWNSSAVIPRLLGYVESITRKRKTNGISPTITKELSETDENLGMSEVWHMIRERHAANLP